MRNHVVKEYRDGVGGVLAAYFQNENINRPSLVPLQHQIY
jgi:hypothetical protein